MPSEETLRDHVTMEPKYSIGAGKPFPPPLPNPAEYTVEFESADDPLRPHNWSSSKKYGALAPPQMADRNGRRQDLSECGLIRFA